MLLAVRRRIFVRLEERDSKAANKAGGKNRIGGHSEKALEEKEAGGFSGREKAHPLFFLPFKQCEPVVKLFLCDKEALTEPFHGSRTKEILGQDAEDEKKAIGGIGDDEIWKDGMGMAAGTDKAQDAETVPDRLTSNEINQGTVIIGMDGAGNLCPAGGAGLQLRAETVHEGIKKFF